MGEDRCYSRHFVFHPEEAVFALTENRCSQVNFYKAKDFYVPICNWKNEKLIKLFISNSQISSMEWNVSSQLKNAWIILLSSFCVLKGDGSQICVCCKDGTLVVWSYPLCDTLLKIQQSTYFQSIHWNPFDKNSFSNLVKSAKVSNDKMLAIHLPITVNRFAWKLSSVLLCLCVVLLFLFFVPFF